MAVYDESDVDGLEGKPTKQLFSTKHALPPLDLSFKSLLSIEDIKEEMETHYQRNLTKSPSTRKYTCNSIRICNNSLNELTGFATVISGIIARIEDIGWLDFSFNDLNNIDDEVCLFPNLKVLYLHGNAIEKILDVKKLTSLKHLQFLTLHGNPIETETGYRQFVLTLLPNLKSLDFSAITKQDQGTAEVWAKMNPKAFKKKRKSEETHP